MYTYYSPMPLSLPISPPATSATATATAAATALFLIVFIQFSLAHKCSPPVTPCPPFTTAVPFPFSASPGCGHPSFPLKCASPNSIITINNLSFSLLRFELNSTSLLLSPQPPVKNTTCTSPLFTIPNVPINFSATPFRVSDSSCSRLSHLQQCPPPNLPNCSHCSWECKLIKNPLQLFHDCESTRRSISQQSCQADVLGYLDNFLKIGIEIEWGEEEDERENGQDNYFTNCKTCTLSNGICGFNSTDPNKHFICFKSKSREITDPLIRQESFAPHKIAILCLTFVFICVFIAVSIGTIIFRSRKIKSLTNEEDPTTLFLHRHRSASLLPPVFTYDELESSTNLFDPKRKIGDGGFGSVFLGQLSDGRIVAVKQLHKTSSKTFSTKSFCNEILILSSINHPNLVKLHGYCSDPRGLLLVYDYIPNGTLADHIHGSKSFGSLTWGIRVEIAVQIALAIEYLHFSVLPPIVHRDVTSSNIFVEKDMRVKVGDFGLSRLLICQEITGTTMGVGSGCVWTGPQGTPGYLDPDYYQSFRLTEKSDVYSFGVILLELITGMRAVDQRREKSEMALVDLVVPKIQMGLLMDVVDPVLVVDREAMDGVYAVAELAFRCVAAEKDDRPNAKEVAEELRRIRSCTRGIVRSGNSGNTVVPDCGPNVI